MASKHPNQISAPSEARALADRQRKTADHGQPDPGGGTSRRTRWTRRTGPSRGTALLASIIAMCVLAGCGGSASKAVAPTSSTKDAQSTALTSPASGCGSVVLPAAQDPDGVLAALPAATRAMFAGYAFPVRKSSWSSWKPAHHGRYTVGIAWSQINSPFQLTVVNKIEAELKADPLIGKVILQSTSSFDVAQQIQQYQSLVQQKPNLIILEPLVGDAFIGPIDKAAAAGIPTISAEGEVPSTSSVNVQSNDYQSSAESAARLLQTLHGKGNVLLVHGITGTASDVNAFSAFDKELKLCPSVKVAGTITGGFVASQAKSATLEFLASHPEPIAGVMQSAIMAQGIMSAFQQDGRAMPIVDDIGPDRGSIGYWLSHRQAYQGVGTGLGPESLGETIANVALGMLEGRGIKVTDVTNQLPLLTDQNLTQWAQPGWSLSTPGEATGPPDSFVTEAQLGPLFNHPAVTK
jgi:ribose transport system substrate-binding protein